MIKNNKKIAMDEMVPKNDYSQRTKTDILSGIGNGILDDLEMSIHHTRAKADEIED